MKNKLIETLKGLRRGKRFVRLCPTCRSADIRRFSSLDGWLTPTKYYCENCGYLGALIIEADE